MILFSWENPASPDQMGSSKNNSIFRRNFRYEAVPRATVQKATAEQPISRQASSCVIPLWARSALIRISAGWISDICDEAMPNLYQLLRTVRGVRLFFNWRKEDLLGTGSGAKNSVVSPSWERLQFLKKPRRSGSNTLVSPCARLARVWKMTRRSFSWMKRPHTNPPLTQNEPAS